jgi:hypothetical protein
MEEIEAPMESLEEEIHHHAHEASERWISQVALSSALFAVFAAIGALVSNHHANEAMIEQIQASDHWGYYQAKGIKATMLGTKLEILTSLNKKTTQKDRDKLLEYKQQQTEISEKAEAKEASSENHLKHHMVLARGVTVFQVAIAIAAISVLTRRRRFWYLGLGFATIGIGFLIQGFFLIPG